MTEKRTPALDNGTIDKTTGLITFDALPFPLPEAWRNELIGCGYALKDARKAKDANAVKDLEVLLASIEIRARATLGVRYSRPFIRPVIRG